MSFDNDSFRMFQDAQRADIERTVRAMDAQQAVVETRNLTAKSVLLLEDLHEPVGATRVAAEEASSLLKTLQPYGPALIKRLNGYLPLVTVMLVVAQLVVSLTCQHAG